MRQAFLAASAQIAPVCMELGAAAAKVWGTIGEAGALGAARRSEGRLATKACIK